MILTAPFISCPFNDGFVFGPNRVPECVWAPAIVSGQVPVQQNNIAQFGNSAATSSPNRDNSLPHEPSIFYSRLVLVATTLAPPVGE